MEGEKKERGALKVQSPFKRFQVYNPGGKIVVWEKTNKQTNKSTFENIQITSTKIAQTPVMQKFPL